MSAAASALATGPRTLEGKATSALNSLTHGLTSKSPLLPSEDPQEFAAFRADVLSRYAPATPEQHATVNEYCDLTWRLQRVPGHEARLIAFEIRRMTLEAKSDKSFAELIFELDPESLEAVAVERLFASKTLTNLHRRKTISAAASHAYSPNSTNSSKSSVAVVKLNSHTPRPKPPHPQDPYLLPQAIPTISSTRKITPSRRAICPGASRSQKRTQRPISTRRRFDSAPWLNKS